MDSEHISKEAKRRRLLDNIQKAQDRVSKEMADTIKLQIANDTAFWEMKEKLAQKENEHETLKQNMLTLQIQYEALSSKHQEELRLRSEVLNKLDANRKVYEVLEKEMGVVMASVKRIDADKVALYDTYMKADKVVCDLKQKHIQAVEQARHKIEVLERAATMSNEHQAQVTQAFSAYRQQADAHQHELKNKLEAAAITKEELCSTVSDLNSKLDISRIDIEKRDETISTLQRDMKDMIKSFNDQVAEARALLVKKHEELKSNADEIELLKGALSNQESITKEVRDQNTGLQENYQKMVAANDGLKIRIEEMTATSEKLLSDLASLKERNDGLVKEVNDKCQEMMAMSEKLNENIALLTGENDDLVEELNNKYEVLSLYESDLGKLKEQINTKDEQIKDLSVNLNDIIEKSRQKSEQIEELSVNLNDIIKESRRKSDQIHSLESKNEGLNQIIADRDAVFENYRAASEDKNKKQQAIIEERYNGLEAITTHVIQVTMELRNSVEERTRFEKELQNVKREKELEMANAKERETRLNTKLTHLEVMIKSKDEELSQQMSKFLEIRNESEREKTSLREKLNALQLKLDNISKETAEESRAQLDDNAVVMTPDHGALRIAEPATAAATATAANGLQ